MIVLPSMHLLSVRKDRLLNTVHLIMHECADQILGGAIHFYMFESPFGHEAYLVISALLNQCFPGIHGSGNLGQISVFIVGISRVHPRAGPFDQLIPLVIAQLSRDTTWISNAGFQASFASVALVLVDCC